MAKTKKDINTKSKTAPAVAPNDNMSWMSGFLLLVVGIFWTVSVASHFIHWSSDLSALRNVPELSGKIIEFENICSRMGATVAYWAVDCSFGIFGIIIPIVITILGWRIFRKKPLHLNHFGLSAALLLIVGSLTMGLVANGWGLRFDIGGSLGQACAKDLSDILGTFGTVLVLIAGWILTGVFINHNFRRIVDSIGDGVEKQGGRVKRVVEDAIVNRKQESVSDQAEMEAVPTPDVAPVVAPVVEPVAEPQPVEFVAPSMPESRVEPVVAEPAPRMTMNEFLAEKREQEIGHPDFGRTKVLEPEEEFFVASAVPSTDVAAAVVNMPTGSDESVVDEFEDDEFIVRPSGGAVPNEIDVEALMAQEKQTQQQRFDRMLDEDGFAVMPAAGEVEERVSQSGIDEYVASNETACEQLPQEDVYDEDGICVTPVSKPSVSPLGSAASSADDHIVVKVHENRPTRVDEDEISSELYDPLRDLENYKKPYVSLLEDYKSPHKVSDAEIYDNKCRIQETLKYFGIPIVDIQATVGPTVTLYEIVQAQGVKISKVQGLEKDIAQSLRAQGIRIIAPIPGRGTIGIEVPNRDKQIVSMYSAICSEEFQHSKMELPVVIGRTIQNSNFTFDLAKLPHLLVAGATGQGKSVGLNAIITSLLYTKHPSQLKFVMIDPKMVEFSVYSKLERHFLAKMESEDEAIVTDPKKAVYVLNSLVEEMGRRLELCKMATARNIVEYNEKFTARRLNPNKGHRFLPYIVVIVDEFADLIMTAKEVEVPVMRLAQKARAVGIHLIIATQRPDVRVITGGIKANFPSRIAFRVIQMIDSRTIIDQPGANQLIGRGDMLFSKDGELTRIQCALVETKEVERLVDYISKQQGYTEAYQLPDFVPDAGGDGGAMSDGDSGAPVKYDVLFGEVARAAVTTGVISTSSIQRNYEVGFNRAGRIMLQLERAGIVGPQVGAKPREIKFYDLPSLEAKLQDLGVF
ncbi:MAG: DNA translocase FtsK 4TM domain-containing protein [Alistipes sp.]|nr:DNA translocase FtsK 4TM domain-containing protein [Alistipes sp.]